MIGLGDGGLEELDTGTAESGLFVHEADGGPNYEYPIGVLPTGLGTTKSVEIIFLARIDNKILVGVPFEAWHRSKERRILPACGLTKPQLLEVAASPLLDREEVLEEIHLSVWVGFLASQLQPAVLWAPPEVAEIRFEVDGNTEYLPYAVALTEVAQEHFAFLSAPENPPEEIPDISDPLGTGESGAVDLSERVSALELSVRDIAAGVRELLGSKPVERVSFSPTAVRAGALKDTQSSQQRKPAIRSPKKTGGNMEEFPLLDQSVVTAALSAGVEKKALAEMQKLLSTTPLTKKLDAIERRSVDYGLGLHPETDPEDQDVHVDPGASGSGGQPDPQLDPIGAAVTKLTQIVSAMADQKKGASSKVEAALDGVHSTGLPDGSGYGSGKRSAAARRALRLALTDHPLELSMIIERLMLEDLTNQTVTPGLPQPALCARAWVEHRSRIGNHKTAAHMAWSIAGALDCIFQGNVAGARARLCLALLQIDQCSIDRGGWGLAAELSLENAPPFQALSQHHPPNHLEGEQPFSKLLDPRWAEVALAHLKDTDDYMTRRRNLQRPGKSQKEDDQPSEPKRRPKAKAKAKQGDSPPVDA